MVVHLNMAAIALESFQVSIVYCAVQRTITAGQAGAQIAPATRATTWALIAWPGGLADFSQSPLQAYCKNITITDYAGSGSAPSKVIVD